VYVAAFLFCGRVGRSCGGRMACVNCGENEESIATALSRISNQGIHTNAVATATRCLTLHATSAPPPRISTDQPTAARFPLTRPSLWMISPLDLHSLYYQHTHKIIYNAEANRRSKQQAGLSEATRPQNDLYHVKCRHYYFF